MKDRIQALQLAAIRTKRTGVPHVVILCPSSTPLSPTYDIKELSKITDKDKVIK